MELKGRVWKFGKDVDTDELFAGRFIMGGDEMCPGISSPRLRRETL
jgi:hypothetical protein